MLVAVLAVACGSAGTTQSNSGEKDNGESGGAGEPEQASLTIVPVSPSPLAWSFFYLPQGLGWYEEENLQIEIIGQIPRGTQTGQLSLGQVDAAHVSVGGMIEYGSTATDLVWIAVTDGFNLNIYAPEDSEVQTSEDLIGTSIGTREVGDDILVESLLGMSGIDSTQYETVPTGGGRGALAEILKAGQVAAIFGSPIDASAIEEAGVALEPVDTGASYAWPNAGIAVRRSDFEARPDVYARFGRAVAKGQVWTQMNAESTIDLLSEIAPESVQDPEDALEIRKILNEVNETSYTNRWDTDLDVVQEFIDVQARIGAIDEPYDASQLWDSSVLDEIWDFDVQQLEQLAQDDQRDAVLGLNN